MYELARSRSRFDSAYNARMYNNILLTRTSRSRSQPASPLEAIKLSAHITLCVHMLHVHSDCNLPRAPATPETRDARAHATTTTSTTTTTCDESIEYAYIVLTGWITANCFAVRGANVHLCALDMTGAMTISHFISCQSRALITRGAAWWSQQCGSVGFFLCVCVCVVCL